MAGQHLIIGLGGTGGSALAALRRTIQQKHGAVASAPLAIEFLYIDISATDTEEANSATPAQLENQKWRTGGTSVQLNPSQIMHLKAPRLDAILNDPGSYPGISSWLGPVDSWKRIIARFPGGMVAGQQLRRYGRYFFASNASKIEQAIAQSLETLKGRIRASGNPVNDIVHIHVVCGLAGGTGSGGLIEILALARQHRAAFQPNETKITAYAALPEQEVTTWATGNYYANGYAAVHELNALMVHAFEPMKSDGSRQRYPNPRPDGIVLFTNRNSQGTVITQSEGIPTLLADTLYQCIIGSGDVSLAKQVGGVGQVPATWKRFLTCENTEHADERDEAANQGAHGERSRRFVSFGIKRISVPEDAIRESLVDRFKIQATRQLLFNNWQDGIGFDTSPRNLNYAEAATSEALRSRFGMNLNQITLQERLLENDPNWTTLNSEFTLALTKMAVQITDNNKNSIEWPVKLGEYAKERYNEQFRNMGVTKYFKTQSDTNKERVTEVLNRIDKHYFEQWQTGELSLHDIREFIIRHQEGFKEQSNALTRSDAAIERDKATYAEAIRKKEKEYVKLLSAPFRGKLIQELAQARASLLAASARQEANAFGRQLIASVNTALDAYSINIRKLQTVFKSIAENSETMATKRLPSQGQVDVGHVVSYVDVERVSNATTTMITDRAYQMRQTAAARSAIVSKLDQKRLGFLSFLQRMPEAELIETIDQAVRISVEEQHGTLPPERQIIRSAILEKLYEDKGNRLDELKVDVARWVESAAQYLCFNSDEEARSVGAPARCFVVFVPKVAGLSNPTLTERIEQFRTDLINTIKASVPPDMGNPEIVDTSDQSDEIVFLSLLNIFPARFSETLKMSGFPNFNQLVVANEDKKIELYTEGDGTNLPPLFPMTGNELTQAALPYYMFCNAVGQIELWENPETGVKSKRIRDPGANALRYITVSTSLVEPAVGLSPEGYKGLKTLAATWLGKNPHVTIRQEIKEKMFTDLNARLGSEFGGNDENPAYQAEIIVTEKAVALLGL